MAPRGMLVTPGGESGVFWVWFWLAVVCTAPLAITMFVVNLLEILEKAGSVLERLRPRAQRTEVQPVERLAADLHRLAVHLDTLERSDEMHRAARLRAAALAYDDTLRSACRTLDVEVPERSPLQPVERLQTEAALAQRGLVW